MFLPKIYAHIAPDGRLLDARDVPPVSRETMGGRVYDYVAEQEVVLECSNCGATLKGIPTEGGRIEVTPCSCRGDCPLCGGSGMDLDARGNSRPCPCKG